MSAKSDMKDTILKELLERVKNSLSKRIENKEERADCFFLARL